MPPEKQPARGLNGAAFASLLARLGADADRAGTAYEDLRRALLGFFRWRGASTPEECADETLDRLAARIHDGVAVDDVPRFARGVARLVLLEHWRSPHAQQPPAEGHEPEALASPHDEGEEVLHQCLDHCLDELDAEGRGLILGYYAAEGRKRIDSRKRMAASLGLSESALRNRAQRLRDRLEACLTRCLASHRRPGDTRT
jgi:DNA-directed RNA polymerase specialized sigma24 family protein